jgi:hypothetical protein
MKQHYDESSLSVSRYAGDHANSCRTSPMPPLVEAAFADRVISFRCTALAGNSVVIDYKNR